MKDNITIGEITNLVENASTEFEEANNAIKRKYLIWNITAFNTMAKFVKPSCGTFGTGYPFYVLDKDLQGKLPVIPEQIRYNRQLIKDGEPFQKSIWECKSCIETKYSTMTDLKIICKACPRVPDSVKPRKIINRLPDLDMWLVCQDGSVKNAQKQLTGLLNKYDLRTSDQNPLLTIDELSQISGLVKLRKRPGIYLPMDVHIVEFSELKDLIEMVPETLKQAKAEGKNPYLPIHPISYRKVWQKDDQAYNFIYDYFSAFTEFDFIDELQDSLNATRLEIANQYTAEELFTFLINSATPANARRFEAPELKAYFMKKIKSWKNIEITKPETEEKPKKRRKRGIEELII